MVEKLPISGPWQPKVSDMQSPLYIFLLSIGQDSGQDRDFVVWPGPACKQRGPLTNFTFIFGSPAP